MQRANKSDKSGYESLLRVYRETDLSQEKTRILGNLTANFGLIPEDKIDKKSVVLSTNDSFWSMQVP